ncbi:MAG: hypothetical protein K9G58_06610 [Bacteroidales bacterium]|nr:hypothetical protein [Bacteroidales bacterium]MCF8388736.1 hypothetical protein [Bacteroidales bacterium]MCF8397820.1 hypothetical protein [Bacteroidales bacterium]
MGKKNDPIILKNGQKLGEKKGFTHLPPGRISKQATGIGATYHELELSKRNSIVVCPTRALAASKAKEHKAFYVGGDYENVVRDSVEEILKHLKKNAGSKSRFTKVTAVADSFIGLYNDLRDHINEFFVMFDEIDSFQSESDYRPKLEDCLEIYFKLDDDKRNMVSATMQKSYYGKINDEDFTEIVVNGSSKPSLEAILSTGDPIKVAATKVQELYQKHPNNKILVAFNTIEGINSVIKILPWDLQQSSGILCSEERMRELEEDYQSALVDGKLTDHITFITAAYFSGIDIHEETSTIIVTDHRYWYSALSLPKISQIFGRSRKGCTERIFIYQTNEKNYKDNNELKDHLKEKIKYAIHLHSHIKKDLFFTDMQKNKVDQILDFAKFGDIDLLRYDKKIEKYKTNYLNIDNILLRQQARNNLYCEKETSIKELSNKYKVIESASDATFTSDDLTKLDKFDKLSKAQQKEKLIKQIEQPKYSLEPRTVARGYKSWLLLMFEFLPVYEVDRNYETIDTNLIKLVKADKWDRIKKYYMQLSIYSRIKEDNNPVSSEIQKHFKVGSTYNPDEIQKGMIAISKKVSQHCDFKELINAEFKVDENSKPTSITHHLHIIFQTTRSSNDPITGKQRRKIKAYKGLSI